jgi:GWxTD domain-containing protein
VEVYDAPPGARIAAWAVDGSKALVWQDTVALRGSGPLRTAVLAVTPARLPLGRAQLEVALTGWADTVRAPLLVGFSDHWVITDMDEVTSLLRYFERQDWVRRLREAPAAERSEVWQALWRETDPKPDTPENEALAEYFARVREATSRYSNEGAPGWMTDRGELFITLGDPDEVADLSNQLDRSGARVIRWSYHAHRAVFVFQDQSGFGRFRLTPASRADYQRVLAEVRRPK